MSTRSPKRRPSDVATDLFKSFIARFRRSDDTKRSLSTGDLVSPPIVEESDYFEMDFTPKATTSYLEPSFDDCDRVPMKFTPKGARLLPQYRKSARRLAHSGSSESLSTFNNVDITLSQPWFYPDIDSGVAERIIREAGLENGLFIVHYMNGVYGLVLCHKGKIYHRRILHSDKRQTKWRLGIEKAYRNIEDLVNHYHKHKGYFLPTKLKNGVPRPLRYGTVPRIRS